MNDRTYRVLEYDKIKKIISGFAGSDITKEHILNLKPLYDVDEIEKALSDTFEASLVIEEKGNLPIGNFFKIDQLVGFAKKGKSLSMGELLGIAYNLNIADNVKVFLKNIEGETPHIKELGELLEVNRGLYKRIKDSIINEDEISESASPELKKICKSINLKNDSIKVKLSKIASGSDSKDFLRDSVVTIRQGRYVVPVKSEHKHKVKGIVHDRSATGSTLFIEPQVVVELNNQLRDLEIQKEKEIARILAELSWEVGKIDYLMLNNQKLLEILDLLFAKARYGRKHNCEPVLVNEDRIIDLKNARHPLINIDEVVPINLSLGSEYRTLIITGPNTGGKTVTLKTLGLLTLMTQSGIPIPVEQGSKISIFKKIYADIGDEQSIEQSLSTFSSHMKNIVEIMNLADEETLVLADELGAGTDPTEGAALAMSILEDLRDRNVTTMATTHYTELKKYAVAQSEVQNASMEFDIDTLRPTYKLIVGIPGKSKAFEISKKLGLNNEIVERAKAFLDKTDISFEEILGRIERDRKEAEEERDEAIALNIAMKHKEEELNRKIQRLEERKDKIISDAKAKAENILKEAESLTKKVQRQLSGIDSIKSSSDKHRVLQKNRDKIKNVKAKNKKTVKVPEDYKPVNIEDLNLGDLVKILSLNQNGEIIKLPDSKGNMMVSVGDLRLSANIKNIMLLEQRGSKNTRETENSKKKTATGSLFKSKAMSVGTSINIVGKNVDEGCTIVDKYLDDAYIAGLKEVMIIHGRGTGVLKKGICKMLDKHTLVESYRKGSFHDGGDGVTVAVLKMEE